MAHKVKFSLPERELASQDISFVVEKDGKRFGTLLVSRGAIEWRPRSKQSNKKVSWSKFDKLMKEEG
jgi:hypothetical protein